MIDLEDNVSKRRLQAYIENLSARLERKTHKMVARSLIRDAKMASDLVEEERSSEIDTLLDLSVADFSKDLIQEYKSVLSVFSSEALAALEKSVLGATETKDLSEEFWRSVRSYWTLHSLKRAKKIKDTTKGQIKKIISSGREEGKSSKKIAKDIRSTYSAITPVRANAIALTEVHSASNYAMYHTMLSSGRIKSKEWLSALDERTRTEPFDHYGANGEVVGISEMFHRTGEPLNYPGDPDGSPANIIRCRCVQIFHTKMPVNH